MTHVFIDGLYRITSNGVGVYEQFKYQVSKDTWINFLKSNAAKWLPKPPEGTYDNNRYKRYESYFTRKGYDMFNKLTLNTICNTCNTFKSELEIINVIDDADLIYYDDYQMVFGFNKIEDI